MREQSRLDQMRRLANEGVPRMRRHPHDEEHRLQVACVR